MKFTGKVGNRPVNKRLDFGGDPVWIRGFFYGFVTIGRYGKRYQPTALRDAAVHGMHQQASP